MGNANTIAHITGIESNADQCEGFNINIEKMNLSNCEVTKRNLKRLCRNLENFPNLTTIDLSHNKFGFKAGKYFTRTFMNSTVALTSINLSDNDIRDQGIELFKVFLDNKRSQGLKHLNFDNTQITVVGARNLIRSLISGSQLKSLSIARNNLGNDISPDIAQMLGPNGLKTLTKLNIGYNDICKNGAKEIIAALNSNTTLVKLDLSGNKDFGNEEIEFLRETVRVNTTLKKLNLKNLAVTDVGANRFADSLVFNSTLEAVDLSENTKITNSLILLEFEKITSTGRTHAKYLAEAFSKIYAAETTEIRIESVGIPRLARLIADVYMSAVKDASGDHNLEHNYWEAVSKITAMHLKDNKLKAAEVKLITDALITWFRRLNGHTDLPVSLDERKASPSPSPSPSSSPHVSSSPSSLKKEPLVGSESGPVTFIELKSSEPWAYLQELHLSGNDIKSAGCSRISRLLLTGFPLRVLDLSNNGIEDGGAKELAAAILKSPTAKKYLEHVNLSNNEIKKEGAQEFLKVLQMKAAERKERREEHALNTLLLNHNHIPSLSLISLMKAAGVLFENSEAGAAAASPSAFHLECHSNDMFSLHFKGDKDMKNIGFMRILGLFLAHDTKVEQLVIEKCEISDESVAAFASCMSCELKKAIVNAPAPGTPKLRVRPGRTNSNVGMSTLQLEADNNTTPRANRRFDSGMASSSPREFKGFRSIHFVGTNLTDQGLKHLVDLVAAANALQNKSKTIEEISLENSKEVTEDGFKLFAEKVVPSLKRLCIDNNPKAGAPIIASLVQHIEGNNKATLETLDLQNCGISDEAVSGLAKLLKSITTLTSLKLTNNKFGVAGFKELASALAAGTNNIKSLLVNLNKVCYGTEGAEALASLLKSNNRIKQLNISNTGISEETASMIGAALSANESIEHLTVASNPIGDAAGAQFLEFIAKSKTIKHLAMYDCRLGVESAKKIAAALQQNSSLEFLDIALNQIGDEGAAAIAAALATPGGSSVKSLNVSDNQIKEQGAKALADALCQNSVVTFFDASNNPIRNDGASAFAAVFETNKTLEILNLNRCKIGDDGARSLVSAHNSQKSRVQLGLFNNDVSSSQILKELKAW